MLSIAEVVGKPPTESVFFEKYARICVVVDEVVNEVGAGTGGGAVAPGLWGRYERRTTC
jgi:hypothetical protein